MLAGEPYRSRDGELLRIYHRCKALLAQFTSTASTDADGKDKILRHMLGRMGSGVWIEAPFFCDYGEQIFIGDNCFINYNCVFLDSNRISIGNHVLIGPAVQLYTATHPVIAAERITGESYLTQSRPIAIGDRCWIGGGAMIMPGLTIGENTTIGAGSVVTADIPANSFAAGNPCRVIRQL